MVQRNVLVNETNQNFTTGHLLTYYCNGSSSVTVVTSVCTEGGNWIPNPAEYTCEKFPNTKGDSGILFLYWSNIMASVSWVSY